MGSGGEGISEKEGSSESSEPAGADGSGKEGVSEKEGSSGLSEPAGADGSGEALTTFSEHIITHGNAASDPRQVYLVRKVLNSESSPRLS